MANHLAHVFTTPKALIRQWSLTMHQHPNPSTYMRQQYSNYGAEQMLAACIKTLQDDGDPLAAKLLQKKLRLP